MPGGEVPALTVTRPSLEDTYLAMIAPHVGHETHETHDTNDLNDPTEVPA
jgi:ABC-2 type transport system ATP-binding protein